MKNLEALSALISFWNYPSVKNATHPFIWKNQEKQRELIQKIVSWKFSENLINLGFVYTILKINLNNIKIIGGGGNLTNGLGSTNRAT